VGEASGTRRGSHVVTCSVLLGLWPQSKRWATWSLTHWSDMQSSSCRLASVNLSTFLSVCRRGSVKVYTQWDERTFVKPIVFWASSWVVRNFLLQGCQRGASRLVACQWATYGMRLSCLSRMIGMGRSSDAQPCGPWTNTMAIMLNDDV
jgi:hypothetical protein